MRKIILIAGLLLFASNSWANMNYYSDQNNGFSIIIPNGWQKISGREITTVAKFANQKGSECAISIASLQKGISKTPIKKIIKIYQDVSIENILSTSFKNHRIIEKKTTYISNKEASQIIFSFEYKTLNRTYLFKSIEWATFYKDKKYQLGCSTEYSDFDDESAAFFQFARTFLITS